VATERSGGTRTAVPGETHALHAALDLPGTYQLQVDCSALAGPSESVTFYAAAKVRAGAAAAVSHLGTAPHGTNLWRSEPIPVAANEALVFSLRQNGGTGREFVWSVKAL
jgi:hypothetical protein